MGEMKYILNNLLSIQWFDKLLNQYAEVIEDIRNEKPEKAVHSIVGVIVKHVDDSELKETFNNMLLRHDEINEKFGQGIEGMMIDPDDPQHSATYEKYKQELDHYLMVERPSTERYILKLAYEKLENDPSILKDFDGEPIQIMQPIELLHAITPKNYIMPNNKLANELPKGSIGYGEQIELKVNKKQVFTQISINYDDDNIQIYEKDKRFTAYDRTVHNSVCSLLEAGNTNFTPDQVYRCMNGLDDKQYVSPQSVGAITRSLDKSRRIHVKVDYTQEAKAYKKDTENCIVEDYVLPARKITLKAGGKEVAGYKLNAKPILYEYAQITKQVLTVPSKLLNTKDVINSTPEVIVIREYLIRRIEVMKHDNKQTNKITLEKIYREIDQPEPNKDKVKSVKNIVTKLLGKFQSEDYIKGYEFYKEGRSFRGIEIFY